MVVLQARQSPLGQSIEQARAHVLAPAEFGVLVDGDITYLLVGDGVTSVGALIDAGRYFAQHKDLPPAEPPGAPEP